MSLKSIKAWLVTDGKAGDEQQCIGIAETLELTYKKIHVKPRRFYSLFMPYGPIDPKDTPNHLESIISPPFPDIAIASGRRAVAYLRKIKAASKEQCFTVFLKNPRTGLKTADFIWVPEHDSLRGDNVLSTLTSPHVVTAPALEKAEKDQRFVKIQSPRIAVLLGGDSSSYYFTKNNCLNLADILSHIVESGAGLMVSPSRRTPKLLEETVKNIVKNSNGFFWDGTNQNPFLEILAAADHIIVTADSANMVGEAVSTGKPIHVFYPDKKFKIFNYLNFKPLKIEYFLNQLTKLGAIRPLEKTLESWSYEPLNATPLIAAEIEKRYRAFQDKSSGENRQ